MKLAIIVLTYNRSAALRPVLQSLAQQCGPDEEVIVADDGSLPEHVQLVRQTHWGFRCPAQHVWHQDVGPTLSSARNMAALRTQADYLVFLDGDCVPQHDFVAQHRRLATRGCFVNGSRVLFSAQLTEQVEQGRVDVHAWNALDWLLARVRGDVNKLIQLLPWPKTWRKADPHFVWKGIRSCNMAIWRDDFCAVDGFDEAFNGWGHEDADLVLRLHHHGVSRINGSLATEVFHLWHAENSRANEAANRARVTARIGTAQVRAQLGLQMRKLWQGQHLGSVPECVPLH
jgi:GT2 family glycosyltransferase